ncbi:Protein of unknown function [Pyronema omphalodes CBS 100304]|uniref:Uncharacterized protein n=1 Tax=Pyronema omphalodes (strain CBS 100304) TaxID=1076935 RepID=U4KVH4_PYROM|nr:Protein of unknown function [Pyronema omphalodes CBS 100304]
MEVFEFRKVTYMERINSKSLDATMRKVGNCLDRLYYLSPALDELMLQAEAADRFDGFDRFDIRPINKVPNQKIMNLKSEPLATPCDSHDTTTTSVVDINGGIIHHTLMMKIDEILKATNAITSKNIALHEAYKVSCGEIVMLKEKVEDLSIQIATATTEVKMDNTISGNDSGETDLECEEEG